MLDNAVKMFKSVAACLVISVVVQCAPQTARVRSRLDGRIVGGDDADIKDYPYQLSLLYHGQHFCGASIIADKWAITAGHCAEEMEPEDLSVRAGSTLVDVGGQVISVKNIYLHPNYNYLLLDYDIALLELAEAIKLSESASVVQMVDANTIISPGTEAVVTGWGIEEEWDNFFPKMLKVVKVPIVSNEVCDEEYGYGKITNRMICAGFKAGGKDACQGDSGGPLVVDGKLAGIVSWGDGCAAPDSPGVYSNIASIRDFIFEKSRI